MIPVGTELDGLQDVIAETRTAFATIMRSVSFPDDAGGSIQSWEPVNIDLSARVSPQGMQSWEKVDRIGGRVIATSVWLIGLPPNTDVTTADRIVVGDNTYEVIAQTIKSVPLETKVQTVLFQ